MIKRFKEFNESISGTEFVGSFGPNYGDTKIKNKTIRRIERMKFNKKLDV